MRDSVSARLKQNMTQTITEHTVRVYVKGKRASFEKTVLFRLIWKVLLKSGIHFSFHFSISLWYVFPNFCTQISRPLIMNEHFSFWLMYLGIQRWRGFFISAMWGGYDHEAKIGSKCENVFWNFCSNCSNTSNFLSICFIFLSNVCIIVWLSAV